MHRLAPSSALVLIALGACSRDVQVIADGGADSSTAGAPAPGSSGSEPASTGGGVDGTSGPVDPSASTTTGDTPKFDLAAPIDNPPVDEPPPLEIPSCERLAELGPTSMGCEFWSIDLDMNGPMTDAPGLGVGLGNPADHEVNVAIEDMRGPGGSLREVGSFTIEAAQSLLVPVNGSGGLLAGEEHCAQSGMNDHGAFRITSDSPITATQINPMGGSAGVKPEGSLLLPTTTLIGPHRAIGYESEGGFGDFVVVVATEDHTTVSTALGDVALDAFDTYRYPDTYDPAFTASGFLVSADAPVAVFSGNEITYVGGVGWADLLEEQVVPLSAWGTHYVGAIHPQRTPLGEAHEPVVWRIVSAVDDTTVTLTPELTGSEVYLAEAGSYAQFVTTESFVAESDDDHPFMLVQYMTGGEGVLYCNASGNPSGDPYMMQMVPTEQWLQNLPFATDTSYVRDFVFIVRTAGTEVSIACLGEVPDDRFTSIGATGFEVGWVDLDAVGGGEGDCVDGQQFLISDAPVAAYVAGIDCAASYGFPGGLNLSGLWDPPDVPEG